MFAVYQAQFACEALNQEAEVQAARLRLATSARLQRRAVRRAQRAQRATRRAAVAAAAAEASLAWSGT